MNTINELLRNFKLWFNQNIRQNHVTLVFLPGANHNIKKYSLSFSKLIILSSSVCSLTFIWLFSLSYISLDNPILKSENTGYINEKYIAEIDYLSKKLASSSLYFAEKLGEIPIIQKLQINTYNDLISEVENSLNYLDYKPDLIPVDGHISSGFGMRIHPFRGTYTMHNGMDISESVGTNIKAAGSGVVTYSDYSGGYGYVIVISHGFGYKSVYAHNNKNYVDIGQEVNKGDIIGEVGKTGQTTGSHLHFEIHYEGVQIDPAEVLNMQNDQ